MNAFRFAPPGLSLLVALFLAGPCTFAETYFPREIAGPLDNPHMGWVYIVNAYPGYVDLGRSEPFLAEKPAWKDVSTVAVLSDWGAVEPKDDHYDWAVLDQTIAYWSAKGKAIQLRFSTDTMLIPGYEGGAPKWIYDLGVPMMTREEWGTPIHMPDYTHPVYVEKLREFLVDFAAHLKQFPAIESADLRGYGTWGEWHSGYDYPNTYERRRALAIIVDAWDDAFRDYPDSFKLYLSTSYEWRNDLTPAGLSVHAGPLPRYYDFLYGSLFDEAFLRPRIAPRRDGVAGYVFPEYDGKLMRNLWDSTRQPVNLELGGAWDVFTSGQRFGYDAQAALDEVALFHGNYLTAVNWDIGKEDPEQPDLSNAGPIGFFNSNPELAREVRRQLGYHLVPVSISMSRAVQPGARLAIEHTWENRANGRLYVKYRARFYLVRDGITIHAWDDPVFDPTGMIRGETYPCYTETTLPALPQGDYAVELALVDRVGAPAIALGIDGDGVRNRYRIGDLRVDAQAATTTAHSIEDFDGDPILFPGHRAVTIEDGPTSAIRGRSVVARPHIDYNWNDFLRSDPIRTPLDPFSVYRVTFATRALEMQPWLGEGASPYFCFVARNWKGGSMALTQWRDSAIGATAIKSVYLYTDDSSDWRLYWGVHAQAAVAVDDVRIERIPKERVVQVDLFANTVTPGMQSAYNCIFDVPYDPATRTPDTTFLVDTSMGGVVLEPNTHYTIAFEAEFKREANYGSHAWFHVESLSGGLSTRRGELRWADTLGQMHRKSISFRTGPETDYVLRWGLRHGGTVALGRAIFLVKNGPAD